MGVPGFMACREAGVCEKQRRVMARLMTFGVFLETRYIFLKNLSYTTDQDCQNEM